MKLHRLIGVISIATLALAAPRIAGAAESGVANLLGPDGQAMGSVTLTQGPKGVLVSASVTGLAPGAHGFHIHQTGSCAPDFGAAGGHYNPGGTGHGILHGGGHHAGDLPNIHALGDGSAQADYFTGDVTLAEGAANSLFDADGSAIVIHENPDSYGEDAKAGGRVACGVIEAR
jgi:Cu-Zn family superoxide dismutase